MHYYKKNIGDYRSATAHLTLLEHGVYNWLLDTYYLNEKPLPNNERELFRLALARTEDEKQAVRDVLDEYFENTENGWVHNRCESEIKAYHAKAETNRKNGGKGGRPKYESEQQSSGNPEQNPPSVPQDQDSDNSENPQETQSVNSGNPQKTLTTNHKPLTKNQYKHTHSTREEISDSDDSWRPDPQNLEGVLRTTAYSQRIPEILNMPDFKFHLGNFNAHWENKTDLTENQRTRKFTAWLIQEFEKQERNQKREMTGSSGYSKSRQPKTSQSVSRNVNDAWKDQPVFEGTVESIEIPEDFV